MHYLFAVLLRFTGCLYAYEVVWAKGYINTLICNKIYLLRHCANKTVAPCKSQRRDSCTNGNTQKKKKETVGQHEINGIKIKPLRSFFSSFHKLKLLDSQLTQTGYYLFLYCNDQSQKNEVPRVRDPCSIREHTKHSKSGSLLTTKKS